MVVHGFGRSLLSCGLVAATFGCGDSEGPAIGTAFHSLESEQQAAIERILSFEDVRDWSSRSGAALLTADDPSHGSAALAVRSSGFVQLESRRFGFDRTPTRLGVDVRVPDRSLPWMGQLQFYLECPTRSIFNEFVGKEELSAVSSGRFESISVPLTASLQRRLAGGCADLVLRFAVNTPIGLGEISLDRAELDHRVTTAGSALCGVTAPDLGVARELPNGFWSYHSWRSGASTQVELARLQGLSPTEGLLGFGVDDVNKRFVAVVDSDVAGASGLADVAAELERQQPRLELMAQPSCRGSGELRDALNIIERADFHPRAKDVALFHYLEVEESRYVVLTDPDNVDVGEALERRLGPLVRVRYHRVREHGRFDDGQPHYGAAAIVSESGHSCTSGFVVDGPAGRGAVTAGHCFDSLGESAASGPYFYGESGKFPANPEAWDMAYIAPAGQSFSPRIHTDPCCPVTRPVTTKVAPAIRQLVCISGKTFLSKCSVQVYAFEPSFAVGGSVRRNVWFGWREGVNIGAEGDSGAPLYIPVGSGNAAVVGMHIAGAVVAPYDETWFHSVTDVEAQLGVSVARL